MTAIEISVRARDTIINYAAIIVRHFVVQTTPHTPSSSSSSSSTIAAASSDINSELGSLTAADRGRGLVRGLVGWKENFQLPIENSPWWAADFPGWMGRAGCQPLSLSLSLTWFNFAFDWDYNCSRVKRIYTRNAPPAGIVPGKYFCGIRLSRKRVSRRDIALARCIDLCIIFLFSSTSNFYTRRFFFFFFLLHRYFVAGLNIAFKVSPWFLFFFKWFTLRYYSANSVETRRKDSISCFYQW